jgi:hypothetical protein
MESRAGEYDEIKFISGYNPGYDSCKKDTREEGAQTGFIKTEDRCHLLGRKHIVGHPLF